LSALPRKARGKAKLGTVYRNMLDMLQRGGEAGVVEGEDAPVAAYIRACLKAHTAPEPLGIQEGAHTSGLFLAHVGMGDERAAALAASVARLAQLRSVDLRDNRLSGAGVSALVAQLHCSAGVLRELDLSGNRVELAGTRALAALVAKSTALRTLRLNGCELRAEELERLLRAFKREQCEVRDLHLESNGLGAPEAAEVASMLEVNKSVTSLNLAWNSLSGAGAAVLLRALADNRRVRTADLRWNLLASALPELADMLRRNRTLTHLDLSFNHLDRDQCAVLGEALAHNHTLLGLHMDGNACTVTSCGFLALAKPELGAAHRNRAAPSICGGASAPSGELARQNDSYAHGARVVLEKGVFKTKPGVAKMALVVERAHRELLAPMIRRQVEEQAQQQQQQQQPQTAPCQHPAAAAEGRAWRQQASTALPRCPQRSPQATPLQSPRQPAAALALGQRPQRRPHTRAAGHASAPQPPLGCSW
jgi:hypothetical protein